MQAAREKMVLNALKYPAQAPGQQG
jgi:hypothetical protein